MDDQEKKLDNLFKTGLQETDNNPGFIEADWNDMERLLDKRKKRAGIVYWLPVLSAAAVALLFLGWWLFIPQKVEHAQQQAAIVHKQKDSGTNGGATQQPAVIEPNNTLAGNNANSLGTPGRGTLKTKSFFTLPAGGNRRFTTGNGAIKADTTMLYTKKKQDTTMMYAARRDTTMLHGKSALKDTTMLAKNKAKDTTMLARNKGRDTTMLAKTPALSTKKPVMEKGLHTKPQLALTVLAAPDVNGVGSFQNGKVGGNFGLLFSAGVSRKISITTGAVYAIKPYMMDFNGYHTGYKFKQNPESVYADCRVLDIPINVNYQVYNKNKNKLSVGTGLSSYFMLSEDYKFNYAEYTYGPTEYIVRNQKKHILGVLNLQTTYQHQLNSAFGLAVAPFMKLPLTDIGTSQVRLQTFGIAVGLSWNINTSKP